MQPLPDEPSESVVMVESMNGNDEGNVERNEGQIEEEDEGDSYFSYCLLVACDLYCFK